MLSAAQLTAVEKAVMAARTRSNAPSASTFVSTSQFGGRAVAHRPLVDHRHAAGEAAGGLDGDVAPAPLEERRGGNGEDSENIVHRRTGDFVVALSVARREEREQVGQGVRQAAADGADAVDALWTWRGTGG